MTQDQILLTIAAHKEEFRRKYGVRRIGVFGSHARGDAGRESDVDVVVEVEKPDAFNLIDIKETLERALGMRVDLVRMRQRMNGSLMRRIQRDAVYV